VEPRGKRRASLELLETPESQEKSILERIFGILWISQQPSCCRPESWHAGSEEFAQFGVIQVNRESRSPLNLQTGRSLFG